jgi:hypothetical protein
MKTIIKYGIWIDGKRRLIFYKHYLEIEWKHALYVELNPDRANTIDMALREIDRLIGSIK